MLDWFDSTSSKGRCVTASLFSLCLLGYRRSTTVRSCVTTSSQWWTFRRNWRRCRRESKSCRWRSERLTPDKRGSSTHQPGEDGLMLCVVYSVKCTQPFKADLKKVVLGLNASVSVHTCTMYVPYILLLVSQLVLLLVHSKWGERRQG